MTWQSVALEDVAIIERTGVDPSSLDEDTPYVGLEHIESGGRLLEIKPVANGELKSTKFAFGPEHILYGKLRPYLAKIALPEFSGICSTDILPILPGPHIDRNYLCQFLRQPEMVDFAASRSEGANLPRLSPKALAKFEIPLPPLDEQKRIAAILDKADQIRQKRRQAIALIDSLTQSIFLEMFGDPVSNPKGWPQVKIGDLNMHMTYGPRFYNEQYAEDGTRIVRITDLASTGELDYSAMPKLRVSDIELDDHRSRPGDILFARTGATVGKAALIRDDDPVSIPGAYFIRMRFPPNILPDFAWAAIRHPSIQKIIIEGSRQSAQQNFSGPGLRRLPFILPPIDAQHRFAQIVQRSREFGSLPIIGMNRLDTLFSSLQHRAFTGQL